MTSVKVGTIKIRPVVLVIALGLVTSLIILCVGLVLNARYLEVALLAALVAFASNIVTAIAAVGTKLIESEEKGT